MNSTHPFYPILIPNTPYAKFLFFLILFVGGSQGETRDRGLPVGEAAKKVPPQMAKPAIKA